MLELKIEKYNTPTFHNWVFRTKHPGSQCEYGVTKAFDAKIKSYLISCQFKDIPGFLETLSSFSCLFLLQHMYSVSRIQHKFTWIKTEQKELALVFFLFPSSE
ncbi:UNVERIFIED_CONTAM: hypothetical protein K2H54_047279 [Gekko kuhli]